jgi:predicted nucleic acid-binding protein
LSTLVVDASIVAKWFLREEESDAATELLTRNWVLRAPDLLVSEIGGVLWKRLGRQELILEQAEAVAARLNAAPIVLTPVEELMNLALRIAYLHKRHFYDCTYLALALRENCRMVTADLRFLNALRGTPLSAYLTDLSGLAEES